MPHERPQKSFAEFLIAQHTEIVDDMNKEGMDSYSNANLIGWAERGNLPERALQALSDIQ